jgi:hypothetical protein
MHITAVQLLILEKARQELERLAAHEDQETAEARTLAEALGSFLQGPISTGTAGRPSQTIPAAEPDHDAAETLGSHRKEHGCPSPRAGRDTSLSGSTGAMPKSSELIDSVLGDVVDSLSPVAACLAALEADRESRKAA